MFEPMGGSAPKYTGQNVINPIAAIAAAGMMLDTLGEREAALAVDKAVTGSLNGGKIKSLAAGRMGMGTTQVGDLIAAAV
jgi:3-isopropylmalate dehydrogenase